MFVRLVMSCLNSCTQPLSPPHLLVISQYNNYYVVKIATLTSNVVIPGGGLVQGVRHFCRIKLDGLWTFQGDQSVQEELPLALNLVLVNINYLILVKCYLCIS